MPGDCDFCRVGGSRGSFLIAAASEDEENGLALEKCVHVVQSNSLLGVVVATTFEHASDDRRFETLK
jgi:hypothetical protein